MTPPSKNEELLHKIKKERNNTFKVKQRKSKISIKFCVVTAFQNTFLKERENGKQEGRKTKEKT